MQNGGNFVLQATPADNIIYLVCALKAIADNCNNLYFSDGHATDNYTTFYDKTRLNDLPQLIDWNAVKSSYWGGDENLNIKRKKQAELLISSDISPNHILGYGCYSESAKQKLINWGVQESQIKIIPAAYY